MVKSDLGIFGLKLLGYIIIILGVIFGLIMLLKNTGLGVIIVILSLVIGKFLIWKSKRREGIIIYQGGNI